ncbi:MAG: serine/threonine-protein kinase [Streptosporangiaceae bacterium]
MDTEWVVPGYRHVRVLGAGASGQVLLAEHLESGVQVAIKYLSGELLADEEFVARFRDEARLLADLSDPNLVYFYEYFEAGAGAAIVMELVDGVSLNLILAEAGPTTPEAALAVLKGSLLGLGSAHAAGIVHRDYKPANVLVDADGHSKLADFGIAVRVGSTAQAAGTPAYMPPEQWSGQPVTPAADVYAATAVCYELLTGQRPYQAKTLPELARAHQTQPIPVDNVPNPLQDLIAWGMAKDLTRRPQTAGDFLHELEGIAGAAYGPEWEERGRSHLRERALALALLFPLTAGQQAGSGVASSVLTATAVAGKKATRNTAGLIAAGALALLVLGGTTTAVVWASNDKPTVTAQATDPPAGSPADTGPPGDDDGDPATPDDPAPSASMPADPADPTASANPSVNPSVSPVPPSVSPKPGDPTPKPTKPGDPAPTPPTDPGPAPDPVPTTPPPVPTPTPTPTPKPTTPKPDPLTVTRLYAVGSVTQGTMFSVTVRVSTTGESGSVLLRISERASGRAQTFRVTGSGSFIALFDVGPCKRPSATATAGRISATTAVDSTDCIR